MNLYSVLVYAFGFTGFRCKMYLLAWVMVRKGQKALPCTN